MNTFLVNCFKNKFTRYDTLYSPETVVVFCKECKKYLISTRLNKSHYLPIEYLIEIVIVVHEFMTHQSQVILSVCDRYSYEYELKRLTVQCNDCNRMVCNFTLQQDSAWSKEFEPLVSHEHDYVCVKRGRDQK
jgi:hypothetical protein